MKNVYTYLLLMIVFSSNAFSMITEDKVSIGARSGIALGKSDSERDLFWSVGVGYRYTDYLDIGVTYSQIPDTLVANDNKAVGANIKGFYPISEDFSLFAETGIRAKGDALTFGAGVLYQHTPAFGMEFGYTMAAKPNSVEQGDVYSMMFGVVYRFGPGGKLSAPIAKEPVIQKSIKVSEPSQPVMTPPQCQGVITRSDLRKTPNMPIKQYVVVKDDWVLKIAKRLCVKPDVLYQLNPWLAQRVEHDSYIFPGEQIRYPVAQNSYGVFLRE